MDSLDGERGELTWSSERRALFESVGTFRGARERRNERKGAESGDSRYHRASVRQRARGMGRGHDHEQVHDVTLARDVVQQERQSVFGVRRVLHGR